MRKTIEKRAPNNDNANRAGSFQTPWHLSVFSALLSPLFLPLSSFNSGSVTPMPSHCSVVAYEELHDLVPACLFNHSPVFSTIRLSLPPHSVHCSHPGLISVPPVHQACCYHRIFAHTLASAWKALPFTSFLHPSLS